MCTKEEFARLRDQTVENTRQINDLAKADAAQSEQIKTLFAATKEQGKTIDTITACSGRYRYHDTRRACAHFRRVGERRLQRRDESRAKRRGGCRQVISRHVAGDTTNERGKP